MTVDFGTYAGFDEILEIDRERGFNRQDLIKNRGDRVGRGYI